VRSLLRRVRWASWLGFFAAALCGMVWGALARFAKAAPPEEAGCKPLAQTAQDSTNGQTSGTGKPAGVPAAAGPTAAPGVDVIARLRIEGKEGDVLAVTYLGDSRLIAVNKRGDVITWDRATLKPDRKFSHFLPPSKAEVPISGVSCAGFSPDGSYVCMNGCFNNHLAIWDVTAGTLVAQNHFDELAVGSVLAVSDSARIVVLAGFDYSPLGEQYARAEVWTPATGEVRTIKPAGASCCESVAIQPSGPLLALRSYSTETDHTWTRDSLWETTTLKCRQELPYEGGFDDAFQFDQSGRCLVASVDLKNGKTVLYYWDVALNKALHKVDWSDVVALAPTLHGFIARTIEFDRPATYFFQREPYGPATPPAHQLNVLRFVDLAGRQSQKLATFAEKERITAGKCSNDGKSLLVGTNLGNVYLLGIKAGPPGPAHPDDRRDGDRKAALPPARAKPQPLQQSSAHCDGVVSPSEY
jgi:hypothetical protein